MFQLFVRYAIPAFGQRILSTSDFFKTIKVGLMYFNVGDIFQISQIMSHDFLDTMFIIGKDNL